MISERRRREIGRFFTLLQYPRAEVLEQCLFPSRVASPRLPFRRSRPTALSRRKGTQAEKASGSDVRRPIRREVGTSRARSVATVSRPRGRVVRWRARREVPPPATTIEKSNSTGVIALAGSPPERRGAQGERKHRHPNRYREIERETPVEGAERRGPMERVVGVGEGKRVR